MKVQKAESRSDFEEVRALFHEYDASLDIDLSFQGIEEEIATLPGKYAAPKGALLLASETRRRVIGCVGVRPFDSGVCEMKRLYVRPAGRGSGAGRALVSAAIAFARELGYREILLDSLPGMSAAIAIYHDLGFEEIPPYWNNTLPGILFFGKQLRRQLILEHFPEKWTPVFRRKCDQLKKLERVSDST